MTKTILLTGATDGIGLQTAKLLAAQGHTLLLHGRSESKLAAAKDEIGAVAGAGTLETFCADLSDLGAVVALAAQTGEAYPKIDVLINNAGVYKTPQPITGTGHDVRMIVNTVAPYLLTQRLLPMIPASGRVVNLSSAAQAPVTPEAFATGARLSDGEAYAISKLGITMWSAALAENLGPEGPVVVAVNPASFLGSKMVKEAYGSDGHDLRIGAEILVKAAISEEFAGATGQYFDNDKRRFSSPHPDAMDRDKNAALVKMIEGLIAEV